MLPHKTIYFSLLPYGAGQWPSKNCMKKCLEFENNAVGHMTFVGQPTCWLDILYIYD